MDLLITYPEAAQILDPKMLFILNEVQSKTGISNYVEVHVTISDHSFTHQIFRSMIK